LKAAHQKASEIPAVRIWHLQPSLAALAPVPGFQHPLRLLACAFTALILAGCDMRSSPKFAQYYSQGEKLYLKHCSNCHQANGSGLGRVYPPLDTSDYMQKSFRDVICLIRHGKSGNLAVNGDQFNQAMPGTTLSDLEVAEIATYIYNTWTHGRGIVEVKEATEILNGCKTRP
jgi:mono/diheme cytochrome c family protein